MLGNRGILAILLALCLAMTACEAPGSSIVCNKPYIQVGTDCCLDQDQNGICDSDETPQPLTSEETELEAPPESLGIPDLPSREAMKLQATNFAQKLSRHWEQNQWNEIYEHIPDGEKEVVSREEFVFFMNITSPYSRAQYDQRFQDQLYGGYYTGFKRGVGLRMIVGDVTLDNSSLTAKTVMSSMSFDEVPLNVPVFGATDGSDVVVEYKWRPFTFIWEDNQWKVQTIGVYFMGNDPKLVCEGTAYPYECMFDYARTFKAFERCDETGYHVAKCYEHFKRPLQVGKAIAGCKLQLELPERDACLSELMGIAKDARVCDAMGLAQNRFICFGMASGYGGNYEECWERITDTQSAVVYNQQAQCIYGYVLATDDGGMCSKIPERASRDLLNKCLELKHD